ncbi:MAG: MarR family transcriptional regulator [Bryobacteraceae bacterium]|nr:MarR family transcriptional regulator [Bryobacteraceae bacterium]
MMPTKAEKTRAELMTDLMRAILKMSAHAHRAGSAMNKDSGLTNARWILIDQAAEEGSPLTISDHARRLGFSRQALKRLAADMVRDGLIGLEADPRDRRVLRVVLTEQGRSLQQEALARGLAYNQRISESLSMADLERSLKTVRFLTQRMIEIES